MSSKLEIGSKTNISEHNGDINFFFLTVSPHLVKNVPVEVRHVSFTRQRSLIIVFEMLFKGQRFMGDLHYCAQVIGQHLNNKHTEAQKQ